MEARATRGATILGVQEQAQSMTSCYFSFVAVCCWLLRWQTVINPASRPTVVHDISDGYMISNPPPGDVHV
jgi:hypothetical protein